MKIGVLAFVASYTADPAAVARTCEALGYESFWLPEHPILPVHHKTPYPGGDGKIPPIYAQMIDPFVGLALAAGATMSIKLGTGICLVPERDPLLLAKEVATLDYYSGGRFLFGIGAGWLRDESEIMGVDFPRRWPITREYVGAMKELWTKPEASFEGKFIKFPPVKSFPKPATKPHPPIHIGAGGERALKNTAAIADGWAPIALSPRQLKEEARSSGACASMRAATRPRWRSRSSRRWATRTPVARWLHTPRRAPTGSSCFRPRSRPTSTNASSRIWRSLDELAAQVRWR